MIIEKNKPLSEFTTWKVGGPADFFVRAKTEQDFLEAIRYAKEHGINFTVIGGGSNILVSDKGYRGLVIKNEIESYEFKEGSVTAGSGLSMSRLAVLALHNNFLGLQWAIGLPGTVGGAVFGNSNCFGGSTGEDLIEATLCDREGKIRVEQAEYFNFSYDFSKVQDTKEIVLSAVFRLKKESEEEIAILRKKITEVAAERSMKQPIGARVAGSTFKALHQTEEVIKKIEVVCPDWKRGLRDGYISAGFIIDSCLHLKGYRQGQMEISPLHANFFVNLGGATATEVKNLIDFVKKKCQYILKIELEEEIKYLGEF